MVKPIELSARSSVPAGDQLFHFTVESQSKPNVKYYVAVYCARWERAGTHDTGYNISSTCTCMDAFVRFPDKCKHQIEAIKFMIEEKENAK